MICRLMPVVFASALMFPVAANPMPLSYSESVEGDLNGQSLAFDVGLNTVTGRSRLVSDGVGDHDPFSFTLPVDASLISARVQASFGDAYGNTSSAGLNFTLLSDELADRAHTCYRILGLPFCILGDSNDEGWLFSSQLPLSGPNFQLLQGAFIGTDVSGQPYGGDFDYELRFQVGRIPEPSALCLAALGLLGLLFASGRSLAGATARQPAAPWTT